MDFQNIMPMRARIKMSDKIRAKKAVLGKTFTVKVGEANEMPRSSSTPEQGSFA